MASSGVADGVPVAAALDKEQFDADVELVGVVVEAKGTTAFMKKLRESLLHRPKVKAVWGDPSGDASRRLVLLSEEVSAAATDEDLLAGLSQESVAWVRGQATFVTAIRHTLKLGYDLLTADQVLRQLLPPSIEAVPSGFEVAGHVAHLNLRDELLPYKTLIAQVILDKHSNLRTVVNKTANIATKYRTFPMEILAGDPDMTVEQREHGAIFRFDFSAVYWNSRLQDEHSRLSTLIMKDHWRDFPKPGAGRDRTCAREASEAARQGPPVVADLMAGVGPFAVPLAMQGAEVYANDLNPESYRWLCENSKRNKVMKRLRRFNMDGRDFVAMLRGRCSAPEPFTEAVGTASIPLNFDHAIMNLPQTAIEFLDAFRGYLSPTSDPVALPMIHVYCFEKGHDTEEDAVRSAIKRAEEALGGPLKREEVQAHMVRDVAPKKPMICLSFRLPYEVLPNSTPNPRASHAKSPQRCTRP